MALMGLREYARHRGVSPPAVEKAIKSGRITITNGKIDSALADASWAARTKPGQKKTPPPDQPRSMDAIEPARPDVAAGGVDYFKARAIRESYNARLAKIDYEEKMRILVRRDEVHVQAFTLARTVRDSVLNVADRVAAELAAEMSADRCHHILTVELRRALSDLADPTER